MRVHGMLNALLRLRCAQHFGIAQHTARVVPCQHKLRHGTWETIKQLVWELNWSCHEVWHGTTHAQAPHNASAPRGLPKELSCVFTACSTHYFVFGAHSTSASLSTQHRLCRAMPMPVLARHNPCPSAAQHLCTARLTQRTFMRIHGMLNAFMFFGADSTLASLGSQHGLCRAMHLLMLARHNPCPSAAQHLCTVRLTQRTFVRIHGMLNAFMFSSADSTLASLGTRHGLCRANTSFGTAQPTQTPIPEATSGYERLREATRVYAWLQGSTSGYPWHTSCHGVWMSGGKTFLKVVILLLWTSNVLCYIAFEGTAKGRIGFPAIPKFGCSAQHHEVRP
ncbi:hypothetical protein BVC80_9101g199 [Macleaya cordata]|uniref:Uncharacterized protein n=1 Tax=Macleaya cordata TaxID=56857 RepID=A0A200QGT3_MACCD|nr:hypothetical protein BVC80_9101g199 [Macleaya cordata]